MDFPLFSGNPTRRGPIQPSQPVPYVNTLADPWGSFGRGKSIAPILAPANRNRTNTQHGGSRMPHSRSDASLTAPLPVHSGMNMNELQFPLERADNNLPANNNTSSLLPSPIAHNHAAHQRLDSTVGYIGSSSDTAVHISVPPYADAQPILVGSDLELPAHYDNNNVFLPLPRNDDIDWPSSPMDSVSHGTFNDPGITYDDVQSSINIHDANRMPQQIGCENVGHDYSMTFRSMNRFQNQTDFGMGNRAFSVSGQTSPTDQYNESLPMPHPSDWAQNQRSMEDYMDFDHQPNTQAAQPDHSQLRGTYNSTPPNRTHMKRPRSESMDAVSSSSQAASPPGPTTSTRHNQRRAVVGSEATRRAGEARRKTEAIFACDMCDSVFTRNHNRLNHMRTHKGESGAQCQRCLKVLAKTSLSRHVKKCRGT